MGRSRVGSLLLLVGSSGALVDCGVDEGPDRVAVQLFELAHEKDTAGAWTDAMFGSTPAARVPELLDALIALRAFPVPSVLEVQPLGPGKVHVDLECSLAAGGAARFTVKLVQEGRAWQVRWFEGPGVEWPRPRSPGDESLTTSSHPGLPPR